MSFLLTLGVSVLVFGILILVHEYGHFFVAKSCGIRVNEFCIGMGPLLFQRRGKDGTLYSIRLLPLGGYNLLESEEDAEQATEGVLPPPQKELFPMETAGRSIRTAGIGERFRVFVAGALMNLVLGFLILVVLVCRQNVITSKTIYSVDSNAACAVNGLKADDTILSVNGRHCFVANDIMYELSRAEDFTAQIVVLRGGEKVTLPKVHFEIQTDDEGKSSIGFIVYGIKKNPRTVVREAANMTVYYARLILLSLQDLATGRESVNNLSGPIGVVSAIGTAVGYGLNDVLALAALISINLGLFNLLPIPGLDGCKLLLLLVEMVIRRPIPPRVEAIINALGMAALLMLMFFATWQDILRMF